MSNFDALVAKLREIFQIDRPDLDFGVYRILNARAGEIEEYLSKRLKARVTEALAAGAAANTEALKADIAKAEKAAEDVGISADQSPKVLQLRAQLAAASAGASEHESQVFSHLLTFFSRYYDKGDFISQRRYKGDTYAIPYSGEEVTLYWANRDQYYTKSGESFSNYSFRLDDGRAVHFRLVAADIAKDNRKDNDKVRRFVLANARTVSRTDEDGETFEEAILPVAEEDSALVIRFDYAPQPKGTKQEALVDQAVAVILDDEAVKARWRTLTSRAPTEKNPKRTLLEKHLTTYTQKNTADYFIHKDLGGFLRREIDFYIKNEVMNLDDVQGAGALAAIERNLRMIQCLRAIALDLITFLASIEEFQKKLWLKKKFVVASQYCVTLDRVPEALYPAIAANPAQWAQWHDFGMRGTAAAGTVENLKAAPFLMVDTALFDAGFRADLLNAIPDLDASLDGLLVHGDNFQALMLLGERYKEGFDCVYIDPPYNTDASAIDYKNGYKSSSWITLLDSRLRAGKPLLKQDGVLLAAIDDAQFRELSFLAEEIFPRVLGTFAVRSNPSGRPTKTGYSVSHEYMIAAGASDKSSIGRLPPTTAQRARFNQEDKNGPFEWRNLRREGSDSNRDDRRTMYYPIFIQGDQYRIPKMEWDEVSEEWVNVEEPREAEVIVYPDNEEGVQKRWRWEAETVRTKPSEVAVRPDRSGKPYIYVKRRPNDDGVVTVSTWADAKHSATEHGTAVLKSMFNGTKFSYPKSIHAVTDAIYIGGAAGRYSSTLDFFSGSGTTGHAVINLNRLDRGKRKYALVEQGQYFETVLKPRIQKIVYSAAWQDGKPAAPETGISHAFKVLKIEGYEDTLNNLDLKRTDAHTSLLDGFSAEKRDDYLMRYMLAVEAKESLLSISDFRKPFDYTLKVAVDSAGAWEERKVDLVETFNYLIGLTVRTIDIQLERGFVTVTGALPTGDETLILWRDCEKIGYEALTRLCDKLAINPADSEFDVVYINGDHNIPSVVETAEEEGSVVKKLMLRQIEPAFLEAMFNVDDV
ncbi:DNA methyltransferase [Methylobacterium sp. 1973]|uniref:DNA methyltransferase n=1 Tax=Methylobacterium sp. 1973 TaxID=3156421 RepID=UPI00339370F8